jgi:hypothetical protein
MSPLPPVSPRAESPVQPPLSPGQPPLSPGQPLSPPRAEDPLNQLLSLMPTAVGSGAAVSDDSSLHYNTHGHVAAVIPPPPLPPLPDLSIPPPGVATVVPPSIPQPSAPAPDINDLWARLQSSGVLSLFGPGGSSAIPGLAATSKGSETIPGKTISSIK